MDREIVRDPNIGWPAELQLGKMLSAIERVGARLDIWVA
jgi:hypothetical protein